MNSLITKLSLKYRMFISSMLTGTLPIAICCFLIIFMQINNSHKSTSEKVETIISLVAERSISSILFEDFDLVSKNLMFLNQVDSIEKACVYSSSTGLFAQYTKNNKSISDGSVNCISPEKAQATQYTYDISIDGEPIGRVIAWYKKGKASAIAAREISLSIVLASLFLILSFLFSTKINKSIEKPIKKLIKESSEISKNKDFSKRITTISDPEISKLSSSLNFMLDSVEDKDKEIHASYNKYKALYSRNPLILVSIKEDFTVCTSNENFNSAFNIPNKPEQVLTLSDFIDHDSYYLVYKSLIDMKHSSENEKTCSLTTSHMPNNSDEIYIKWSISKVDISPLEFLFVGRDVTKERKMTAMIKKQADEDFLTGLWNRRKFEHEIKKIYADVDLGSGFYLANIDLDRFKLVNDTSGHHAGDFILKHVVEMIKKCLYSHCQNVKIFRLGGDEFSVIFNEKNKSNVLDALNLLINHIDREKFIWEDSKFKLALSIGLVHVDNTSTSIENWLRYSDEACYAAKNKGGNTLYEYKGHDLEINLHHEHVQTIQKVDLALENDLFELHAQKIQPVKGEKLGIKYEILLRLVIDGQFISPDIFLTCAEKYKRISSIDQWVIKKVFAYIEKNQEDFKRNINEVSINISGISIGDKDFLHFLKAQFLKFDIPYDRICFELTETAAIENINNAKEFLSFCKRFNCKVAIDDFGSGLSSYGYIGQFDADYIKIDGCFIRDLDINTDNQAIVKSIIFMAELLNKKVVAEFVENKTIMSLLTDFGVDYLQGYHIHKPESFKKILEQTKSKKITSIFDKSIDNTIKLS